MKGVHIDNICQQLFDAKQKNALLKVGPGFTLGVAIVLGIGLRIVVGDRVEDRTRVEDRFSGMIRLGCS